MRRTLDIPGAIWQLARLAVISRLRFRGPYWSWRLHTAFGPDLPAKDELVRAAFGYGRWVHRIRRGV